MFTSTEKLIEKSKKKAARDFELLGVFVCCLGAFAIVASSLCMGFVTRADSYTEPATSSASKVAAAQAQPEINPAPSRRAKQFARYIRAKNHTVFPDLATMIAEGIVEAAETYALPDEVLLALIEVESSFDHTAVSHAEAIGLTQVHQKTWFNKDRSSENLIALGIVDSVQDLYDPAQNIAAGAYILHRYYTEALKRKDPRPMQRALTRYFGGQRNGHYGRVCARLGEFRMYTLLNS